MVKKANTFFVSLFLLALITSCVGEIPINEPKGGYWKNEAVTYNKEYDMVWDATLQAAKELDWDISWSDRPTGKIQYKTSYVYNSSFEKQERAYVEPTRGDTTLEQVENARIMPYLRTISYFEKATPRQAPPHPLYTKEKLNIKVKREGDSAASVKANYLIVPFFDYKIGQLGGVRSKGKVEKALYARIDEIIGVEDIIPPSPPEMEDIYELADIFFDFDKSNIRQDAIPVLIQNAKTLKDNPDLTIVINGYADIRGTDAYNLRLGKRRARATKKYFVSHGIHPNRIIALSKGETVKFAPGTTEDEYQLNRRSHIIPVDPKAPVKYPE